MPNNEITFEELQTTLEQEILTYGDFLKMSLFWLSTDKSMTVSAAKELELVRVNR